MGIWWLKNLGSKESRDTWVIISEHFPEIPRLSPWSLDSRMFDITNFFTHKNWEKFRDIAIWKFTSRIEEWFDHTHTIFWMLGLVKDWIQMDLINGYNFYLIWEMNEYFKPLSEYYNWIMSNKENYPDKAIRALCEYYTTVEVSMHEVIEREMTKAKTAIWIKDTETVQKTTKRRFYWLLPA